MSGKEAPDLGKCVPCLATHLPRVVTIWVLLFADGIWWISQEAREKETCWQILSNTTSTNADDWPCFYHYKATELGWQSQLLNLRCEAVTLTLLSPRPLRAGTCQPVRHKPSVSIGLGHQHDRPFQLFTKLPERERGLQTHSMYFLSL